MVAQIEEDVGVRSSLMSQRTTYEHVSQKEYYAEREKYTFYSMK
jgi:hypothetical protein